MLVPISAAPTLTTEVVAAADKISAVGTGTSTFVPGIVIEVVSATGCGRSVGQLQRQILVMAVLVAGFLSLALLPLVLVAPLLVERAQQASPPLQQR
jgi:TRAP-type mannitol/chloroaromatic compound transport system permease large subunit